MAFLRSIPWGGLLLGYCALIFWLSSQSALPAPMLFSHQDKLVHATAYAVMAVLCWQWMSGRGHGDMKKLGILSVAFCALYGLSDEFHQSFVPSRDASIFDWLADVTGAAVAVLFMRRCPSARPGHTAVEP